MTKPLKNLNDTNMSLRGKQPQNMQDLVLLTEKYKHRDSFKGDTLRNNS